MCDDVNPDGVRCLDPTLPSEHRYHMGRDAKRTVVNWPSTEFIAPVPKPSPRRFGDILDLAKPDPGEGAPAEITASWEETKAEWIENASQVIRSYAETHAEDFTTPEDIWPLLDSPGEMRVMTVPVQRALKKGWIVEVAGKRLAGTYHTRDGVQFPINKLSPVYRSRIAR